MKNYFEASTNIELLLSCAHLNLSEEKILKFTKRRKQCLNHLETSSGEKTPRIPDYKPNKFEITFDELDGRNGVALEDIEFGECILVDEPIAFRLKNEEATFCDNCLSRVLTDKAISSPMKNNVRPFLIKHFSIYNVIV